MRLLYCGLLVWGLLLGSSRADDDRVNSKQWEKAFRHKQTGIIFPVEIGAFQIESRSRFGTSDFDGNDTSVRYVDGDTKIDVYLYNKGLDKLEDDEDHEIIMAEISSTTNFIKHFEGKHYFEVEVSDEAEVITFGNEKHSLIQTEMQYREADEELEKLGKKKQRQESSIALTIYSNYLIKIRHSFLIPADEKDLEAQRAKREEFQDAAIDLIIDTIVRSDAEAAVRKFIDDPTDKGAAGSVVVYAEESKLLHVSIGETLLPFLAADDFKGSGILMVGFIAGNITAQWKDLDFRSRNFEGVQQMLQTYQKLKATNAVGIDPALEKWSTMKDDELRRLVETLVAEEAEKP